MCGIAGWVGQDPTDPEGTIRAMTAALRHRGPDGEGRWVGDAVALGMTRLAIIDLQHGDQPKDAGSWRVVFNGEIYNHRQLRAELAAAGRRFTTDSDTEVVAHAIDQWDTDAFSRFDGMFAIAAFDTSTRRLVLGRDRFGEKPLYLWPRGSSLAFASEPKALRPLGALGALDPAALTRYLHLGFVTGSDTIWSELQRLPPAHHAVFARGALTVTPTAISGASDAMDCDDQLGRDRSRNRGDPVEELDRRLRAAVTSRLIADVDVGVLLSGGIDSSLIAAHAAAVHPGIRTFTVAMEDPNRDESPFARAIATQLHTDHVEVRVGEREALAVVHDLPRIFDEPFADASAIPTTLLSRVVAGHVKVALAGEGGDELFSGYGRHAHPRAQPGWGARVPTKVARVLQRLPWAWWARPRPRWQRLARATCSPDQLLLDDLAVMPRALLRRLGAPLAALDPLREQVDRAGRTTPDRWPEAVDRQLYLPDDLLVKVDRASMSTSLEVRVPFLAPDIVDWVDQLDAASFGPAGHKQLSRALARRHFGSEMADRPKQGFSVPLPRWLRGQLRPLADLVCDGHLVNSGFLDRQAVIAMRRALDRRFDPVAAPIWTLAMFELWHAEWGPSS